MSGDNVPVRPMPLSADAVREWLAYAYTGLIDRRDELVAALEAMAKAHAIIDSDEDQGAAAENVRMAATLLRTARERHDEAKRPFLDGGAAVDKWFRETMLPIQVARGPVETAMADYAKRKADRERARLAEERRIAEADAEAKMREVTARLVKTGTAPDAMLEDAAQAADKAQAAVDATHARPAAHSRVRGNYGAVASLRTEYEFEVTDLAAIPREYLRLDDAKIAEAKKRRGPDGAPTAVIPGGRWKAVQKVGVR